MRSYICTNSNRGLDCNKRDWAKAPGFFGDDDFLKLVLSKGASVDESQWSLWMIITRRQRSEGGDDIMLFTIGFTVEPTNEREIFWTIHRWMIAVLFIVYRDLCHNSPLLPQHNMCKKELSSLSSILAEMTSWYFCLTHSSSLIFVLVRNSMYQYWARSMLLHHIQSLCWHEL